MIFEVRMNSCVRVEYPSKVCLIEDVFGGLVVWPLGNRTLFISLNYTSKPMISRQTPLCIVVQSIQKRHHVRCIYISNGVRHFREALLVMVEFLHFRSQGPIKEISSDRLIRLMSESSQNSYGSQRKSSPDSARPELCGETTFCRSAQHILRIATALLLEFWTHDGIFAENNPNFFDPANSNDLTNTRGPNASSRGPQQTFQSGVKHPILPLLGGMVRPRDARPCNWVRYKVGICTVVVEKNRISRPRWRIRGGAFENAIKAPSSSALKVGK
ncbi:uncharacterized protein BDR25DRAFT_347967 [Lindgomyces ingoldianus]|uniref:Uncharacterized protein n=1 Tax=Lindgomyces ingoldianus TaxID=673940 RepID=A0ACB6RH30_9PLEO|nr:uncharacterized protein BDR25DRAFT_347967 [Lindgomyces ingoldianus]KAF2477637.1 hypothetical protein BDR25DRAFT_347967 [Lindgomyces ingoldianus]